MSNSVDTNPVFASLPSDRAFLLQLRYGSGDSENAIKGRIEHIISGSARRFHSETELIAWIHSIIKNKARP